MENNCPIKEDIIVILPDYPKKLRLGFRIRESIGIVIFNTHAINKIEFLDKVFRWKKIEIWTKNQ